ncbi:hypothetical protein GCM10023219_00370 [Stakelama sediminis]|nr:hypothetical protein [Stakelama sediminis]
MAEPDPSHTPLAGGAPLVLCILAGGIIGAFMGQAFLGAVIGLAVGTAIAVLIWMRDRGNDRD